MGGRTKNVAGFERGKEREKDNGMLTKYKATGFLFNMNRLPALQKLADQIADTEQQLPDSVLIILRDIREIMKKITFIRCLNTVVLPQCVKTTSL